MLSVISSLGLMTKMIAMMSSVLSVCLSVCLSVRLSVCQAVRGESLLRRHGVLGGGLFCIVSSEQGPPHAAEESRL